MVVSFTNKETERLASEQRVSRFMFPVVLSRYRLAQEIGVPAQRIGDIVNGERAITADTDLRLCRFFDLSDGYWLRAQTTYDIEIAQRELAPVLKKIKPWAGKA